MDEWNPGLVSFCSARQKRILSSAMHSVVEGGYLLYSTCSYSKEENEDNLDHIMDSGLFESIAVEVPDEWNVVESISAIKKATGYRFYPNKVRGEGFFCAIFQKTEGKLFSISACCRQAGPCKASLGIARLDRSLSSAAIL